jgi:branched-chain amino acid transport system ATP-binding protein
LLQVESIYVGYYSDIDILQGVSLKANEAQITCIIGPNGVGKSTLLKTIIGFLTPNKGRITYRGKDITGLACHEACRRGITYLLQNPSVFPTMTVEENLQLGAWSFRKDKVLVKKHLDANYERFPVLKERRRTRACDLSGGQQRIVELARSLMIDPDLLLMDEPTAGLAPKLFRTIYDELVNLREEKRTILLVDQNISQAIRIADYVYALELGKNKAEGPKGEFENLKEVISDWLSSY